jgi:hypothetical protein
MAWERRKGRNYYYRSRWVNGRVVREYVGTGVVAEMAARLDAEAAEERALVQVARLRTLAELEELDLMLEQIDREVNAAVSAAMAVAGFHWHRGEWRKKTMTTPDATNTTLTQQPQCSELVARARTGDTGAMNQIMPLFDDPRNVDAFGGNVAMRSTHMVITRMVGQDLVSEEAIQRKLELLRTELAGPNPAPLERLVVDRVVALWLHLHKLEGEYAVVGDGDPTRAGYYHRAITSAQKRYFTAIRELTNVRRKTPQK